MKEYVTIREAADLMGVTPQTLRNWEKQGKLIPYRNPVNNYRMYKISQVEDFLDQMRNNRRKRGKFRIRVVSEDDK